MQGGKASLNTTVPNTLTLEQSVHNEPHPTRWEDSKRVGLCTPIKKKDRRGEEDGDFDEGGNCKAANHHGDNNIVSELAGFSELIPGGQYGRIVLDQTQ